MISVSDGRPVARRRPQPAADENVDPIDVLPPAAPVVDSSSPARGAEERTAPAAAPIIPAPALASSSQLYVTLNVRVAPEVNDLVLNAMASGMSKRAAVEHAIRSTYGRA